MYPRLWLVVIAVLFLPAAQTKGSAAQSSPASSSRQPEQQPPHAVPQPVVASASTVPVSSFLPRWTRSWIAQSSGSTR